MNIEITGYRVLQIFITLIFALAISDFRKKNNMIPLINPHLTRLLKFCYFIPIIVYVHTLVTMDDIYIADYFVTLFSILGTYVVIKAKKDLGEYHTWTGNFGQVSAFVCKGIYSSIRHPLYTGIYIFILATLTTVLLHASALISLVVIVTCSYIMGFMFVSAKAETRRLKKQFGLEFETYCAGVHPFLPLRQYTEPPSLKKQADDEA
jgi:protein-S-isoprenylcysteine O-methyltransferase Ste14